MVIGIDLFCEPAWERLDRMLVHPFIGPADSYPINARKGRPVSTRERLVKDTEEWN